MKLASRLFQAFSSLALLVLVQGCSQGGLCPLDTPDCCENYLFGCGTFDLPFGCTCEQYGVFSATKTPKVPSAASSKKSKPTRSLSGTWRGGLTRNKSTCLGAPANLNGVLFATERNGKLTIVVPGYGTLRGSGNAARGYKLRGAYVPFLSSCKADIQATFLSPRAGSARINAKLTYSCGSRSCSAEYQGNLKK